MSTKRNLIIAVIVLILILLAGWYLMSKKSTPNLESTASNTKTLSPNQTQTPQESTNLKALLAKGVAQSCTFSTDATSGTVYVSGGKVRGDFTTQVNGQTTSSHMIAADSTSYIWSDGQNVGFKMTFDPNSVDTNTTSSQNNTTSNFNANYNYNCTNWTSDSSKFSVPANVTFSTFAMPQGSAPNASGSSDSKNSQCSYCASLTGDQKTQCLTALKCN